MFSYRHAFHAGNHADVLKHIVLMLSLEYLTQKDTPLTVVDTHAGVGIYELNGEYAQTSQESLEGVAKLWNKEKLSDTLARYLDLLHVYNADGKLRIYPGSPLIINDLLRPQDQLHLYEIHPVDERVLQENIQDLKDMQGRRAPYIQVHAENGFTGVKAQLPPASRRGLVLMDPSYELKTDYQHVQTSIEEALQRFATGVYLIWYPIVALPQAHVLPKQLKRLAQQYGRGWLNTTLRIRAASQEVKGLLASGMFVINPPYVLQKELKKTMEELVAHLQAGKGAQYTLEYRDGK